MSSIVAHPPYDALTSCAVAADVLAATRATPASLAARQSQRLESLLDWAAEASPLYGPALRATRGSAHERLTRLKPVRKAGLMQRFDEWVTDPALDLPALRRFTADASRIADPFLGRYVVWESSGSSGEPGVFVQDARSMAVYDALEGLRRAAVRPLRRLVDPWLFGERMVFVGATGGHFASTVSVERLRRLNPLLRQRLQSVSFLQPMPAMAAQLEAIGPTVLATYPSLAVVLGEEREAGRLRISPQEVWTGGETLSAPARRFIERAFGCPVTNSYGASEFLSLASDCACGRLHLNADWVVLEPVDEQGQPVPPGRMSASTLLTNLANRVQPLIRYDLGDRVVLQQRPCSCGSALPQLQVQGRCDDTLRLGPPGRSVAVVPLALSTVLEDDAGLFDFQLVQQGPNELVLSTGLPACAAGVPLRRGREALASFLAEQGAPHVRITCCEGLAQARGRSGKAQRVVGLGGRG